MLAIAYANNELPKYLLLENVKNLVGKQFKPQFDSWVKWLDSIGYNTSWKVLNSKHFGIPQNRERVFAISIRKDIDNGTFQFPEEIPLTTRLKNILEKNVDEKYYLPDERIEKILNSSFMKEKNIKPTIIEESKVVKVGQASSDGSQCGTVYSTDDLAPTLTAGCHGYAMGYIAEEQEPFIVASRGRNPENPSDRTPGAPTEHRLEPNFSGCTNTLTSVQKDNYVVEPQVAQCVGGLGEKKSNGGSQYYQQDRVYYGDVALAHPANIPGGSYKYLVEEPIIYDDYNSRISSDQDAINTLTCNCGTSAERNGVKIIEPRIVEDQFPGSRDARIYTEYSPTLRQNCNGLKVANGDGEIIEKPIIRWRIRKLTAKECFRLMNFTDEDCNRVSKYISSSAQYKQCGNSIVVGVLIAIFSSLFFRNEHKAEEWTKYSINYYDGD